jgi:hypothetical protein
VFAHSALTAACIRSKKIWFAASDGPSCSYAGGAVLLGMRFMFDETCPRWRAGGMRCQCCRECCFGKMTEVVRRCEILCTASNNWQILCRNTNRLIGHDDTGSATMIIPMNRKATGILRARESSSGTKSPLSPLIMQRPAVDVWEIVNMRLQ